MNNRIYYIKINRFLNILSILIDLMVVVGYVLLILKNNMASTVLLISAFLFLVCILIKRQDSIKNAKRQVFNHTIVYNNKHIYLLQSNLLLALIFALILSAILLFFSSINEDTILLALLILNRR